MSKANVEVFEECDLWLGKGSQADINVADIDVEYDFTPASHTDHPYGEGTAREYHPAEVNILSVKLRNDVDRTDEDGNVIGKLAKGTDLLDQPWWLDHWSDWLIEEICERVEASSFDDFDDLDDFDDVDELAGVL